MDTSPKHARAIATAALHLIRVIDDAILSGDWTVDGACDPDAAIYTLREAIGDWLKDGDAA